MTHPHQNAAEITEAEIVRDSIAAELDATPGTSEAVNRLVGRFIAAEQKYRDLAGQTG